jgi:hypothetical protein
LTAPSPGAERIDALTPRRLALLFLVCGVLFFPMIFNPVIFGFFDAESDAERLEHVQDNLNALRLLFSGIGVTELFLGFALWRWGQMVLRYLPGRSGSIGNAFSWVAVAAGVAAILSRWANWLSDAAQIASGDPSSFEMLVFGLAAVGFSLTFIIYGVLMIRSSLPTWLGGVWVFCGVIFWVGILPLWFFVGAVVFGIWGLLSLRPGRAGAEAVVAIGAG